jgi:signal transduction histidine kinase
MEQVETTVTEPLNERQDEIKGRVLQVVGEGNGKVLIVEDEVELAEVLEFNLLRQGFDVLLAPDGLEACRLIGKEKPDLILLDLMLPLLDGWEICRMVRSHRDEVVAKTPIIMLSALGSPEDRVQGYELGADLYLPKPYIIKEVIIKAKHLLKQRREYLLLNEQLASLQNQTDLQGQWQQAMFHELRNQLTVISGLAEHLKSSTSELVEERSEKFAGQIIESSNFLGEIAENYLLVRRIEESRSTLVNEQTSLLRLLEEVVQLLEPSALKKACQLELNCPADITVETHPLGLKIILSNLLDNALKYSPLDSQIIIKVEEGGTEISIRVQDDGPGIPEAEREKVFEKFYRGRNVQKSSPGNGLGLYMAHTLAASMGGVLSLADSSCRGCCFELLLLKEANK